MQQFLVLTKSRFRPLRISTFLLNQPNTTQVTTAALRKSPGYRVVGVLTGRTTPPRTIAVSVIALFQMQMEDGYTTITFR